MSLYIEEILAKYWYDTEYVHINKKEIKKCEESRCKFNKWMNNNLDNFNMKNEWINIEKLDPLPGKPYLFYSGGQKVILFCQERGVYYHGEDKWCSEITHWQFLPKSPQEEKPNANERIICAAVWYKELPLKKDMPIETYLPKNIDKGIVFSGHRHGQCIYTKCAITGLRDCESGEHEQGFLTSKNRFVGREEALDIALRENQVIDVSNIHGNKLYSEDLY